MVESDIHSDKTSQKRFSGPLWAMALQNNPDLIHPERLKGLMLWHASGSEDEDSKSEILDYLLKEDGKLTPESCYHLMEGVSLTEKVYGTFLKEFGPDFVQRPSFPVLMQKVLDKLAESA